MVAFSQARRYSVSPSLLRTDSYAQAQSDSLVLPTPLRRSSLDTLLDCDNSSSPKLKHRSSVITSCQESMSSSELLDQPSSPNSSGKQCANGSQ